MLGHPITYSNTMGSTPKISNASLHPSLAFLFNIFICHVCSLEQEMCQVEKSYQEQRRRLLEEVRQEKELLQRQSERIIAEKQTEMAKQVNNVLSKISYVYLHTNFKCIKCIVIGISSPIDCDDSRSLLSTELSIGILALLRLAVGFYSE